MAKIHRAVGSASSATPCGAACLVLVDVAGVQVGVDRHLLPGIVEGETGATSATRPAPFMITMNWITMRMRKIPNRRSLIAVAK
jgi:hypothetical protein